MLVGFFFEVLELIFQDLAVLTVYFIEGIGDCSFEGSELFFKGGLEGKLKFFEFLSFVVEKLREVSEIKDGLALEVYFAFIFLEEEVSLGAMIKKGVDSFGFVHILFEKGLDFGAEIFD